MPASPWAGLWGSEPSSSPTGPIRSPGPPSRCWSACSSRRIWTARSRAAPISSPMPRETLSFGGNASLSYNLLPLDDVLRDERAQPLRPAADNAQSLFAELFDDLRNAKNFVDF